MPLHVGCVSRRSFLKQSVGAGATVLAAGCGPRLRGVVTGAKPPTSSPPIAHETWALLSDTHIAANVGTRWKDVNMADHLRRATAEVLALDPAPAGVIVNGDCAWGSGYVDDYRTFGELAVDPLASRGLPVHLTLGNHDNRARFLEGLGQSVKASPVEDRVASFIRGRHANLFLLDTLDRTRVLSGLLGKRQIAWLDESLAAAADLPAVVVGHHPMAPEHPFGERGGLRDGEQLWQVLRRHRHVKAYLFGHNHFWGVNRREGIYVVNLPATSYTFMPGHPTGWVQMTLAPAGATLRLHRIGGSRVSKANEVAELAWS